MDLLKLGIPSNTKLTRSEWGIIRRKIRKRPRLFSKRFIRTQIKELEKHREIVRKVQISGKETPDAHNTRYEVLAAPKVGTTVTAYHSRARLIHRGTVLAHNKKSAIFLIQFERKELGWDWVKDVEIASHGVPDVILVRRDPQASCNNSYTTDPKDIVPEHGSLLSGTSFSPLIGKLVTFDSL